MNRNMDKVIVALANVLAQALIENGYNIKAMGKDGVIPGYLSFDINIHKYDDGRTVLKVENVGQRWSIEGEYIGTGFINIDGDANCKECVEDAESEVE